MLDEVCAEGSTWTIAHEQVIEKESESTQQFKGIVEVVSTDPVFISNLDSRVSVFLEPPNSMVSKNAATTLPLFAQEGEGGYVFCRERHHGEPMQKHVLTGTHISPLQAFPSSEIRCIQLAVPILPNDTPLIQHPFGNLSLMFVANTRPAR